MLDIENTPIYIIICILRIEGNGLIKICECLGVIALLVVDSAEIRVGNCIVGIEINGSILTNGIVNASGGRVSAAGGESVASTGEITRDGFARRYGALRNRVAVWIDGEF